MSKIDHEMSKESEKEIDKVVKQLGCKVSSLVVHMNDFDMNVVELEVILAKTTMLARIVIEVEKGKWVGFIELEKHHSRNQYKDVSFSASGVRGVNAVYRILDSILATEKITYDLGFVQI